MSNILIAGLHKTGTTGLYNALKGAVPLAAGYYFLYEPKSPEPFLALGRYAPHNPIVAKVLINRIDDCAIRYSDFDRRVMLIRDPRDITVSRLLFRPMYGWTSYKIDVATLDPFIAALKEKEHDPASYSVKGLHDLADELGIGRADWGPLGREMTQQLRILDTNDFHTLRYEDFVDNRLEDLNGYLDLRIENPRAADSGWTSHIQRTMGHGEWKHWFLDEDIEFFGNMFTEYLDRFSYLDWERPAEPSIDPQTSSEHIAGRTRERILQRQARERGEWSIDRVQTEDELHELISMAADGRARWAYRLALVYDKSPVFGQDRQESLRWARFAAHHGHAKAMELTARLLTAPDGHGVASDGPQPDHSVRAEARFWQREHDRLTGKQPEGGKGKAKAKRPRQGHGEAGTKGAPESVRTAAARHPPRSGERASLPPWRSFIRYRLGTRLPQWARGPVTRAMSTARRVKAQAAPGSRSRA